MECETRTARDDVELTPRKQRLVSRMKYITKINKIKRKRLQMRQRRLVQKVVKLEHVIDQLKEKFSLEDNHAELLKLTGGACSELMQRRLMKLKKSALPKKYSEELRTFAITLHYLSPKAYNYVRKVFNNCLPHENTISSWYKSIDGNPGLTQESFIAVKEKVKTTNYSLICSLVVDEMAIRRHIQWDGNQFHGYVSMGGEVQTDFLEEAKDAFVVLLVAINSDWKIPLGYFLVNGLGGEQRANIVKQCLIELKDTGVRVVSLTFDGCPANINMANVLGCNLSIDNLKTTFTNPATQEEIAVLIDPCHCLKLVRNSFHAKKVLFDENGDIIKWEYIENLEKLQTEENFVLANKLRLSHINFQNNIMKVKLASQLFSRSVSDALHFCENRLRNPDFENVDGTCKFLNVINDLFDILNSKNNFQKGYKKPINKNNCNEIMSFLNYAENYLLNLYTKEKKIDKKQNIYVTENIKLVMSQRKTGFLGFIICIQSFKFLFNNLVDKFLKHIPGYKLSQDHIEIFFSNIRAKGGYNNNPTAIQFRSAYKKLLIRTELYNISSGNCISQQNLSILTCSSVARSLAVLNSSDGKNRILGNTEDSQNNDDFNLENDFPVFSEFSLNVIHYIAGFVVKKINEKVSCEYCVSACVATQKFRDSNYYNSFIKIKHRGGLFFPSEDVFNLCTKTEQYLRSFVVLNCVKSSFNKIYFVNSLMRKMIGTSIFINLNDHQFDQDPLDNHIHNLTKLIIQMYVNIRLHFICRNMKSVVSRRQHLTKTILFQGQ